MGLIDRFESIYRYVYSRGLLNNIVYEDVLSINDDCYEIKEDIYDNIPW